MFAHGFIRCVYEPVSKIYTALRKSRVQNGFIELSLPDRPGPHTPTICSTTHRLKIYRRASTNTCTFAHNCLLVYMTSSVHVRTYNIAGQSFFAYCIHPKVIREREIKPNQFRGSDLIDLVQVVSPDQGRGLD